MVEDSLEGQPYFYPQGIPMSKNDFFPTVDRISNPNRVELTVSQGNDPQVYLQMIDYYTMGGSLKEDAFYADLKCYGYGANRIMSDTSLTASENTAENAQTLFRDDQALFNVEEWLLQLDYSAKVDSPMKRYAKTLKNKVIDMLITLLPGVSQIRFTPPIEGKLLPGVEFETSLGWVSIWNLSLGYRTMISWLVDLAYRMYERYPESDAPYGAGNCIGG